MSQDTVVCTTTVPPVNPARLPTLTCAACGTRGVPTVGPGTTVHAAAALCRGCGRHLKWLGKDVIEGAKEAAVVSSVNRVILTGTIGPYGVTVKYATSGAPCANFTLVLSEQGADGKLYQTFVGCEVWGKRAEAASDLEAGQLCLFEGKLAKRKKGEVWELIVSGFELLPMLGPTPAASASRN